MDYGRWRYGAIFKAADEFLGLADESALGDNELYQAYVTSVYCKLILAPSGLMIRRGSGRRWAALVVDAAGRLWSDLQVRKQRKVSLGKTGWGTLDQYRIQVNAP